MNLTDVGVLQNHGGVCVAQCVGHDMLVQDLKADSGHKLLDPMDGHVKTAAGTRKKVVIIRVA